MRHNTGKSIMLQWLHHLRWALNPTSLDVCGEFGTVSFAGPSGSSGIDKWRVKRRYLIQVCRLN